MFRVTAIEMLFKVGAKELLRCSEWSLKKDLKVFRAISKELLRCLK